MPQMKVHIFPHLSGSLLCINEFLDADFYAKYDMEYISVCDHEGKEVLRGNRNSETKLWMIDLEETTQ